MREVSGGTIHGEIGERPASLAVVQAVAAFRGVEPTEMEDLLHDYVDPDALDNLIEGGGHAGPAQVTIPIGDLTVDLWSDGRIAIREPDG